MTSADFTTIKDFEREMPEAYNTLLADYRERTGENGKVRFDDLQEFIKELGNDTEDYDTDGIMTDYDYTVGNYRYEVQGLQYRKDHCLCEEELEDYISVTDLVADKADRTEKTAANRARWNEYAVTSGMKQLLDVLENIDFPETK